MFSRVGLSTVLTGQWSPEQERLEVRALARRYAGLLHEFRLEALGRRLRDHRPVAVRWNRCGFSGDRWTVELDDGNVLRMKLYWPHRNQVAALCSLAWVDDEGWRAVMRTTAGQPLVLRAFHATLNR
jgi:hypothetical protein